MTRSFEFTVEITTTDNVSDQNVERTIAQFIERLSGNENVLTAHVDMEKGETTDLTEDERERLLSTVESLSREEKQAAMEIAVALSDSDE
jgi:hypothetical protein